nr:DUF21 domain-containing protein At5g52790 [Ipomoea batatas]
MAANDVPCCETMFWVYLVICVALVAFAGLMSGLTLGLMSLSLVDLEVLIKAGEPADRKNAEKILPIVKNQHLLLCTLLICNALAMEALPIFIDALLPAWGAILISVTLILAFGEIIPQAICSRYGLSIGARLSPLVRLLLIVVFPISYPISKLLDFLLGKGHSALLRRAELKTLVNLHGNEAGKGGELTHDETTIIAGALDLTQKTAKDAMTPLSRVFSLDLYSKLNEIRENLPLYDILNQFQKGDSHMAVVVKSNGAENAAPKSDMVKINVHSMQERDNKQTNVINPARNEKIVMSEILGNSLNSSDDVLGIITMEDVLEELLQFTKKVSRSFSPPSDSHIALADFIAICAVAVSHAAPFFLPTSMLHRNFPTTPFYHLYSLSSGVKKVIREARKAG